jgi:tetratricopeptide (TPR) repeat protein
MKKYILLLIVVATINSYAQFTQYDKVEYNGYTPLSTEEIVRPAKIMYERSQSNAQKIDALIQYIFEIKKQIAEPQALEILDGYYKQLRKYATAKDLAAPYMSDFIRETQWNLQEFVDWYNNIQKSEDFYNKSNVELKNGNYQQALIFINNAIQITPTNYFYPLQRGLIFKELKEFSKAIGDYNTYIEKNPNSAIGYYYRAKTYTAMERYQDAMTDYSKCISLDNNNVEAYYGKGVLLYEEYHMYQQCINNMDEIISRNSNIGELYFLRGIAKTALYGDATGCSDLKKAYELGIPEAQNVMLKYCK